MKPVVGKRGKEKEETRNAERRVRNGEGGKGKGERREGEGRREKGETRSAERRVRKAERGRERGGREKRGTGNDEREGGMLAMKILSLVLYALCPLPLLTKHQAQFFPLPLPLFGF